MLTIGGPKRANRDAQYGALVSNKHWFTGLACALGCLFAGLVYASIGNRELPEAPRIDNGKVVLVETDTVKQSRINDANSLKVERLRRAKRQAGWVKRWPQYYDENGNPK